MTVACVTLGRPSSARLATFDGLGTKSIVNGCVPPGTESVAVSPVCSTRRSRCGRAIVRTSRPARTASA